MKKDIVIFSDGASKGNPGPGGWGAVVALRDTVTELGGNDAHTTNNRMELTAAIEALLFVRNSLGVPAVSVDPQSVALYTDSRYVINGITKWIVAWQKRDWKTMQKQDVVNRDLWEALHDVVEFLKTLGFKIEWNYVGGHIGIAGNERVDEIASGFAESVKDIRGVRQVDPPHLFSGPRAVYTIDISNISFDTLQKKEKSASRTRSKAQAYSYVSMVDGIVQTHATWAACEARVRGVSGAKFKKTLSAEDEAALIAQWQ